MQEELLPIFNAFIFCSSLLISIMGLNVSLFPGGVHTDVIKWIKEAFQHDFPEAVQGVSEQHELGSFQLGKTNSGRCPSLKGIGREGHQL